MTIQVDRCRHARLRASTTSFGRNAWRSKSWMAEGGHDDVMVFETVTIQAMTDISFYHLTRQPLDKALPALLEKCLERKWSVVVQASTIERVSALDAALWTTSDDGFLPHGAGPDGADEPIWLTTTDNNLNGAAVRVMVDGAPPPELGGYERALILFDGHDPEALEAARGQWKTLKDAGHALTYWQQDDDGRWAKKA